MKVITTSLLALGIFFWWGFTTKTTNKITVKTTNVAVVESKTMAVSVSGVNSQYKTDDSTSMSVGPATATAQSANVVNTNVVVVSQN